MNQILLKIPLPMRLIPEIDMMDIDALSGNEETSVDVEDLSDYFQNLSIDHETTTASFDVADQTTTTTNNPEPLSSLSRVFSHNLLRRQFLRDGSKASFKALRAHFRSLDACARDGIKLQGGPPELVYLLESDPLEAYDEALRAGLICTIVSRSPKRNPSYLILENWILAYGFERVRSRAQMSTEDTEQWRKNLFVGLDFDFEGGEAIKETYLALSPDGKQFKEKVEKKR